MNHMTDSAMRSAAEIRERLEAAKVQMGTPGNPHWMVIQLAETIGQLEWVLGEADDRWTTGIR